MILEPEAIILGKEFNIIFEIQILGKSSSKSIINSKDFGACYCKAKSKAVLPFRSGFKMTKGMEDYSWDNFPTS